MKKIRLFGKGARIASACIALFGRNCVLSNRDEVKSNLWNSINEKYFSLELKHTQPQNLKLQSPATDATAAQAHRPRETKNEKKVEMWKEISLSHRTFLNLQWVDRHEVRSNQTVVDIVTLDPIKSIHGLKGIWKKRGSSNNYLPLTVLLILVVKLQSRKRSLSFDRLSGSHPAKGR
jgi:hypothetical protein